MKKIIFLLAALPLLAVACTEPELKVQKPTISFEKQGQTLPGGATDVKLIVSGLDANDKNEYIIGLEYSGTALEDEYKLSSDRFVVGGASPITSIRVISNNLSGKPKTLTLTLVPQDGVIIGKYPTTTVTMDSQNPLIYDFLEETMELKAMATPQIMLSTEDYAEYYPEVEMRIPAAVDTEKSTAVLGEHFEFVGEPEFFMTPEEEFATAKLRFLKKEEGKDIIVLQVDPEVTRYIPGDLLPQCTITIIGPDYNKLDGEWYVAKQITDKKYMASFLGESDLVGFPVATENDKFTFNVTEGKLVTSLQSELKNFFGKECNMIYAGGISVPNQEDGGFTNKQIEMLDLDNCNRDFSASSSSKDKNAYIGFRILQDGSGEEILELNLIDYKSTSFAQQFLTLGSYNPERPMATNAGCYLVFNLKRVK